MVDTNVLVSSVVKDVGNEVQVLDLVVAGQITLYATAAIMAEYEDVLTRRKFAFAADRVATLLGFLRTRAVLVQPHPDPVPSPDPADTKFIACAMAAPVGVPVDVLATGNRRHFPEPSYGTAAVVNARQLLDRLAARF